MRNKWILIVLLASLFTNGVLVYRHQQQTKELKRIDRQTYQLREIIKNLQDLTMRESSLVFIERLRDRFPDAVPQTDRTIITGKGQIYPSDLVKMRRQLRDESLSRLHSKLQDLNWPNWPQNDKLFPTYEASKPDTSKK